MANITILPFDLKGTLQSNRFANETHTLTRVNGKTNRMFAPKYGAYYKESLEVRTSAGVALDYDTDYVCTYYYDELWELNAKECCAIIVIVNPNVGNDIQISYQAVGGPYSISVDELKELLEEVDSYPRDIGWDDIRNKPLQFPPELHYHEYWQLYGLDSTVVNLEMIGKAWEVGRKGVLSDNRFYYQNFIQLAQKAIDDYKAKVMDHITDRSNPHQTDKVKVGLGLINNWAMANPSESSDITINNKYQPIGGVYDQLENHIYPVLDIHTRNQNNPHRVQLTDPLLNLYSTTEIQRLFDEKLKRTDSAYDTKAFQNIGIAQLYNNFRTNLPASSLLPGSAIPQDRIAPPIPGWNPEDYVLNGNNQYIPFSTLMKTYNDTQGSVYYIGAQPLSDYNYLSVGTYVIRSQWVDFNGGRTSARLYIYQMTSTGWANLT